MGILSTLPFGILRNNSDNFEFLQKSGIDACPECKQSWNSGERSPVQEKCGHIKCRRCFVKTLVAVKDACPQCISACPECQTEWNDQGCSPVQEICGHIKCKKCFGRNLVAIFTSCPQCQSHPEWSQWNILPPVAGPPEPPEIEILPSDPPKLPCESPPKTPPKRIDHITGRRTSNIETSPLKSKQEEKERRRSTGAVPVKIFESKWEKKMQESTFKKKSSFLKRTVFTHSKITKTVKSGKVSKLSKSAEHEVTKTEKSPTSNKIPDHIKIMGSESNPIYECLECMKRFKTRQNIKYHAFCGQETSKPYKCDICPRWFSIKSHYKYHMMTHRKDMPFKCHLCTKMCPDQAQLNQHLKFHSAERNFMCDQCGRSFHKQNILDNHMMVHAGRPHKCKFCNKTFARLVFLNKHELVHITGEKPFKCTMCDTSLCRKDGLERHVLNVHKMDPRTMPSFAHFFQTSPKPRNGKSSSKSKIQSSEDLVQLPTNIKTEKVESDTDTNITNVENCTFEEPKAMSTEVIQETVIDDSWKKKLQEAIVIDEGDFSIIPTAANFDVINRDDFMELKLESSFSRPFICPMCGNSFAHQDDVDWHVRMMHSSADSCSSQSDHGMDSRHDEPLVENHAGANIMALFNGHDSPISYEMTQHVPSSSEFVQPLSHCSAVNTLEFTGQMIANPEFPPITNGPACDFIEPAHIFTEPYLGQNQAYNTGPHYIEPACVINGPGFPYQPPPTGLESEKFNDLTTLSNSFIYNPYEQTPEHMSAPDHLNNGDFLNSHQTMVQHETEYAPPDNPKTYTDLCNAYSE